MKKYLTKIIFLSLVFAVCTANFAQASETNGTIVTGGNAGYAWSDQIGWVNFGIAGGSIHITDSGITGYAWNVNRGWINIAPSNGGVTVGAGGALSGYAWGSNAGWVNFSGVSINSSGKFTGQATGSIIGTLTFNCDNCDVRTDYRPQNFRTVSTPTPPSGGGGGGGGGGISYVSGPGGQAVPAHINAYNVPMKLFPAQSGTLTQNLTSQKSVILDTPSNIYSDDITFSIKEEAVASDIITSDISVIGNALFSITAWDKSNNSIHTFLKPIKITLNVPEFLQSRSDLGVYYFDEASNAWVKIPDAIFSNDAVSFYINHLTLFAIFSLPAGEAGTNELPSTELPSTLKSPFPLPTVPIQSGLPQKQARTEPESSGQVPSQVSQPAQLFDIGLSLESASITRIKDLTARVAFTNFGKVPTPVEINFSILGENGSPVWQGNADTITVETERIFTKRFLDAANLNPGSYTLKLHTRYNKNVEDDFTAPFRITAPSASSSLWFIYYIAGLLLLILIILFVIWRRRRKEKYENKYGK